MSTATLRLPNGQVVQRSVRQIALLESNRAVVEVDELDHLSQSDRVEGLRRATLSHAGLETTMRDDVPVHSDPGHGEADVVDSEAPGKVVAAVADPVPSTRVEDTQVASASHYDTRKKPRHRGYYRMLHEGQY
jgi:hypothetical protein